MTRYASRTVGCFGFFEPNISKQYVWDPIKDMFFQSMPATRFDDLVNKVHKTKTPLTKQQKDELIPFHESYMNSMIYAHDSVLDLCLKQFHENNSKGSSSRGVNDAAAAGTAEATTTT